MREDFPDLVIGVIARVVSGGRRSETLAQASNWHRGSIDDQELAACLLPEVINRYGVPGVRKGKPPILRPPHWGPDAAGG